MLSVTSSARKKIDTDGEIRTHTNLFLRQAHLPIVLRRLKRFEASNLESNWSGRQDSNLRTLAPKASPYRRLRNAQKKTLASGKGFEPLFPDSKSGVLPVGRPRNVQLRITNYELRIGKRYIIRN